MINMKTKNALAAISLLSFNSHESMGVWRYAAPTPANAATNAPLLRTATLH